MSKTIFGIPVETGFSPELDPAFIPLSAYMEGFLKTAREPFAIAAEREGGQIQVFDTFIHGTPEMAEADLVFVERVTKFLLYSRGALRVTLCGNEAIYQKVREIFSSEGERAFDEQFMRTVYGQPLEILHCAYADKPQAVQSSVAIGRHLKGCRIGFDAGGSDRKVSAVIDGEPVFSEEVVWTPKIISDPQYHWDGVADSMKRAASHLPRVDAVGISCAGVFIENKAKVSSLFIRLSEADKRANEGLFEDVSKSLFPDVPVIIANDGDVTALAGAMSLDRVNVLGIAMGTSEAAGYVDENGSITGWLNELAFAPIDLNPDAMMDEWSGDKGCGVKYLSQDGAIKLAGFAGIELDPTLQPGEKLKVIQGLMAENDPRAVKIYEGIGVYLAYALKLYAKFYAIDVVLLLGRVVSGEGGNIIRATAQKVLEAEAPELRMELALPTEKSRRVGQSVAAASLPE